MTLVVGDAGDRAVAKVARDGTEKRKPLHVDEVDAKRDLAVELRDGSGQRNSCERGDTRGCCGTGGLAFEDGDVWPVDDEGAACIVGGIGAVSDVTATENGLKSGLVRAANLAIEIASSVSSLDVPSGEHLFLFSYRGDHGVRRHGGINILNIRVENIEAGRMLGKDHSGSVKAVDTQRGSGVRVHGDATDPTHVSERQDVGYRILVIPDRTEVRKIADHCGVVMATIR